MIETQLLPLTNAIAVLSMRVSEGEGINTRGRGVSSRGKKIEEARRVYTRGGVSLGMHEWSVQDFYIEGRGRRSFDATSLHGDSRERGTEIRAKVRNLGMEYLACEVGSIEVS